MDFEKEGKVIFAGRNVIKLMEVDGENVVVKRFRRPGLLQKIVYTFFRKTKAYRAFHNGEELIKRGFVTPKPIRYIETRRYGLIDYCYYITSTDFNPPIEDLTDRDDWDHALSADFGRFVAQLHSKGILHHDLNDTNVRFALRQAQEPSSSGLSKPVIPTSVSDGVYLKEFKGPESFTFSLIDINRMSFYPLGKEIPLTVCLDNLTRFTGRYDLFEYVVREYAKARKLDEESTAALALKIKTRHDRNWYRRKRFTGYLKRLISPFHQS